MLRSELLTIYIHYGAKNTAPFLFCNNCVKTFCSEMIIGVYIYLQ